MNGKKMRKRGWTRLYIQSGRIDDQLATECSTDKYNGRGGAIICKMPGWRDDE